MNPVALVFGSINYLSLKVKQVIRVHRVRNTVIGGEEVKVHDANLEVFLQRYCALELEHPANQSITVCSLSCAH